MIHRKIINKFSSVHRFSGNFLFQSESVPDHSLEMALICINFAELVPESDKNEMCYRCIIHDLEESITSDVPRPLKHFSETTKKVIDEAAYAMLDNYLSSEMVDDIKSSKSLENLNGFLVHIADKVQCYMKMSREVNVFGNKSLSQDFEIFKDDVKVIFDEISNCTLMSESSATALKKYLNTIIY